MKFLLAVSVLLCATLAYAQKSYATTTPVPILKQINRHNEDGSYSYGYEAADGSYKIETKQANGEVHGKYGYVDDSGNLREIEYGANKNGFQPQGTDINVPPPTVSESKYPALGPNEEDDGQYREDPKIYEDPRYNTKPAARPAAYKAPAFKAASIQAAPVQQYQQHRFQAPQQNQYYQAPTPAPAPQQYYQPTTPAPQAQYYQPQPRPQQYYNPQPSYYNSAPRQDYYNPTAQVNIFRGHPATNLDLSSGSYTVQY
jgi:hypothetical protein